MKLPRSRHAKIQGCSSGISGLTGEAGSAVSQERKSILVRLLVQFADPRGLDRSNKGPIILLLKEAVNLSLISVAINTMAWHGAIELKLQDSDWLICL